MTPHLDKHWTLRLHDISPNFDFRWDNINSYWTIIQHKVGYDWVVSSVSDRRGIYRPIDGRTLEELRFGLMVASHGGYKEWAKKHRQATIDTRERNDKYQDEENLQMGKEVAPLLASLADAGTTSIHGKSKFMFPGFGESKMFGGAE